jgi:uncharacterized protein YbjT (DUF2867 family)
LFVVAGASGNTGKVVAEALLAQKKQVRVLVRDAQAAASWKDRGAEVASVALDDVEALTSARAGAEGACLLLPPSYGSSTVRADNAKRAAGYARAIDASSVKHVVIPMVATRDIGAVAARALLDGGRGKSVIELEGPCARSPRDVVQVLSRLTSRTVEVQQGTSRR